MPYRWPSVSELVDLALDQADTSARCDRLLERVLLGAVLAADRIDVVWHLLGPGDFHEPVHAMIWAACLRARAEAVNLLDAVTEAVRHVPAAAERVEELVKDYVGGEEHIGVLLSCASSVRRAALQRQGARW